MNEGSEFTNRQVTAARQRGVAILAKSLCRDMFDQGYERKDVINLATALLDQVMKSKEPMP